MSMRWYVVHAYSGFEKSVQRALLERIQRQAMQQALSRGESNPCVVIGSPNYMSPEQAMGRNDEVGVWSDIYDLGDRIVVGELTVYPAGGAKRFEPPSFELEQGRRWGERLQLDPTS